VVQSWNPESKSVVERPDGKSFRAARRKANVLFARLIVEMPGMRQENRAKKRVKQGKQAGKNLISAAASAAERKTTSQCRYNTEKGPQTWSLSPFTTLSYLFATQ
jgi:hypothetical protein